MLRDFLLVQKLQYPGLDLGLGQVLNIKYRGTFRTIDIKTIGQHSSGIITALINDIACFHQINNTPLSVVFKLTISHETISHSKSKSSSINGEYHR